MYLGAGGTQTQDSAFVLPTTLLDLLSNVLVLDQVLTHLSFSSIFALSRANKSFREFILHTPRIFRYVDLSRCRGTYVPPTVTAIDSGGHSWRAERMDENLTEDEFLSGPIRGAFSKLSRISVLKSIHVLVLDGLASVTLELVSDIITDSSYDIRILSLIGCANLNQRKLQQLLCYVCRPGRPDDSPRLKGLYYFGTREQWRRKETILLPSLALTGVTSVDGAQLGGLPRYPQVTPSGFSDPWYAPTGRVIAEGFAQRSSWEDTLQFCKGLISFDAVLCTHMHNDMAPFLHDASADYLAKHKPAITPLASIALGSRGCAGCGRAPEGAPIWGKSNMLEFPLLRPPPMSGQIIDAVRPPSEGGSSQARRLIVSCSWCLANRHCENCHRWWCGACYNPQKKTARRKQIENLIEFTDLSYLPAREEFRGDGKNERGTANNVKVLNGLCVEHCLVGEMMAAGSGGMWG